MSLLIIKNDPLTLTKVDEYDEAGCVVDYFFDPNQQSFSKFEKPFVASVGIMRGGLHYNAGETYCGNVNDSSMKTALKLATMYDLQMVGGDIDGAYLITRTKTLIAILTPTPEGYIVLMVACSWCMETYTFSPLPVIRLANKV